MRTVPCALAFALLVVGACAPPASTPSAAQPQGSTPPQAAAPVGQGRTLIIAARGEPASLGTRGLRSSFSAPIKLFNATLDYLDEKENAFPYLAEALPQVNTDTWKINPDGTMETTYHLRPNLTWHDGQPLTADDFVYAYQFFSTPELGLSSTQPTASMAGISAPDPRTVVISWKQLYADAAAMDVNFQPLPRHILEPAFQGVDAATIINHPFWTVNYVGLGPFKIDHWEPGAYIDGSAFDGHALGRPKIDRIRVQFIADSNAAVAGMLSGEIHFISDYILWWEDGRTIEQEWPARGTPGTVL